MGIKEKIWLKTFEWRLKLLSIKVYRNRIKYCRKGFHKLVKQSISWKDGNKKRVTIYYLKCNFCNYMFFVTKKQKEKYLEMEKNFHNTTKDAFSAYLKTLSRVPKPKHYNGNGRDDKRTLRSVSRNV